LETDWTSGYAPEAGDADAVNGPKYPKYLLVLPGIRFEQQWVEETAELAGLVLVNTIMHMALAVLRIR
jgi:hypothetical protein